SLTGKFHGARMSQTKVVPHLMRRLAQQVGAGYCLPHHAQSRARLAWNRDRPATYRADAGPSATTRQVRQQHVDVAELAEIDCWSCQPYSVGQDRLRLRAAIAAIERERSEDVARDARLSVGILAIEGVVTGHVRGKELCACLIRRYGRIGQARHL